MSNTTIKPINIDGCVNAAALAVHKPFFKTLTPAHTETVNAYLSESHKYRTLLFFRQCDEAPLIVLAVKHGDTTDVRRPPIHPAMIYVCGKIDPRYPVPPRFGEHPLYQYVQGDPLTDDVLHTAAVWTSRELWSDSIGEDTHQRSILTDATTCGVGGMDIAMSMRMEGLFYITPTPASSALH